MIKEVKFQGLCHSPSEYDGKDGELGACLNLIPEDGALKPISAPSVAESFKLPNDSCSIKFVHKVTHGSDIHSHYIINCTNGSPYKWYWTEKGGDGTKYEIDLGDFEVNSVTAVGNIICFVGDETIKYAFWRNGDYIVFDKSMFKYDIKIESVNEKNISYSFTPINVSADFTEEWDQIWAEKRLPAQTNTTSAAKNPSSSLIVFQGLDALINSSITNIDQYTLKYVVFGVVALKLYDNSYINISTPFILCPNFVSNKFIWRDSNKKIGTSFAPHKHRITISTNIPSELEDLIVGADIFTTQPESFLNLEDRFNAINNGGNYLYDKNMASDVHSIAMDFLSEENVYKKIDGMPFFKSVSIGKSEFNTPILIRRVLGTEETLSLADFKKSSYGGLVAYAYNNRLHIANIKNSISNAFSSYVEMKYGIRNVTNTNQTDMFEMQLNNRMDISDSNFMGVECDAVFAVHITENSEQKVIYEKCKIQYPIPPMICYPSVNATIIDMYVKKSENEYIKKSIRLHQSDSMGMSYYINLGKTRRTDVTQGTNGFDTSFGSREDTKTDGSVQEPSDVTFVLPDDLNFPTFMTRKYYKLVNKTVSYTTGSQTKTQVIKRWSDSGSTTSDFVSISKDEYNKMLLLCGSTSKYVSQSPSIIKVSEAENPLVFPAKNSVQVGSSATRALASNTRPISEGQFGDAPLYAFTDEGVWTLTPSTEGTYVARQPANRDICSNPSGILQIDDAVLFPTERGVVLQEGRTSRCITDSLDGYPMDFTTMYKESFADKVLAVNGTDKESIKYAYFRKFMEKADMIYDYYDNRIILFNPDYKYAYVYSIKSGMWGAMYNYFSKRVNIYPESYAVDKDNNIVDVYDKSPSADVPYFLCSRPLTLDLENIHKTMFSCIARGYFGIENGKCGIVLYGSNDLQHWQYIKSSVNKYLRGMAGSPYKYFKVAMIGNLSPRESITGISTDIQERWSNKLR